MKKKGHIGAALLVCSLIIALLGLLHGLAFTFLILLFERIPDQDQYIPDSVIRHREETHSLTFAAVIAFVSASSVAYPLHLSQEGAMSVGILSSPLLITWQVWLFVGAAAVLSMVIHMFTDILTIGGGYRVEPLWPFADWSPALGYCRSDNEIWNIGLLASGMTAMAASIIHETYHTLLLLLS